MQIDSQSDVLGHLCRTKSFYAGSVVMQLNEHKTKEKITLLCETVSLPEAPARSSENLKQNQFYNPMISHLYFNLGCAKSECSLPCYRCQ